MVVHRVDQRRTLAAVSLQQLRSGPLPGTRQIRLNSRFGYVGHVAGQEIGVNSEAPLQPFNTENSNPAEDQNLCAVLSRSSPVAIGTPRLHCSGPLRALIIADRMVSSIGCRRMAKSVWDTLVSASSI